MLSGVLAEDGGRNAVDSGFSHQLLRPALPSAVGADEIRNLVDACRNARDNQLLRGHVLYEVPSMVSELEVDLALSHVAPRDAEGSVLRVPAWLRDHPCDIRRARNRVGARHGVHHVVVAHLSGVVDEQNGDAVLVGETLEIGELAIIARIAVVTNG